MKDQSVLFLDIDGVLNSDEYDGGAHRGGEPGLWENPTVETICWDPMAVARLRRIVARTGCAIVISSAWRGYPEAHSVWKWKQIFGCYGWHDVPVIGETPRLPATGPYLSDLIESSFRGDEVLAWLKDNGPVRAYVCLDDHDDFHPKQPLVRTTIESGLQDDHVERAIEILNKDRG